MPRIVINAGIELDGDVVAAFAYLVNVRRHQEWGGWDGEFGLVELAVEGDEALRVGTRFRSRGKERFAGVNFGYRDVSTVTVLEPPKVFSFRTRSWTFPLMRLHILHHYELRASDGGAQINYMLTAEPGNLSAWLNWPIGRWFSKRDGPLVQRNLERFKEAFVASESSKGRLAPY